MTTESDDLALRRKEILDLCDRLGNVTEACRRAGIQRSSYYEYRRRFRDAGLAGLRDRPSVHRSHPMSTPRAVEERLVALSFAHPSWGCVRLAAALRASGARLSAPTAQKLLVRHGLGTARERWLHLEARAVIAPDAIRDEQAAWIEAWNPAFRERDRETSAPGELLLMDTRTAIKAARVVLHFAVDAYGGLAFASLSRTRAAADPAQLLADVIVPHYAERGLSIESIITADVPLYWGSRRHLVEAVLARNAVEHHGVHLSDLRDNGFVERFWRDVHVEFLTPRRAAWSVTPIERLRDELGIWVRDYNSVRPYLGYRNQGVPPLTFSASTGTATGTVTGTVQKED